MDINSVIDYIHCPYKLKYAKDKQHRFLDVDSIRMLALSSVTKFYLFNRYTGKPNSIDILKKQLSKIWHSLKQNIDYEYDWEDLTKLQDSLLKLPILFPNTDELIAVGYPTELTFGKLTCGGAADALFKRSHNCTSQLIITIFDYNSISSLEESIKASYYIAAIKADLRYTKMPIVLQNFKLNGTVLKLIPNQFNDRALDLIENVMKSQDYIYPRIDKGKICNQCIFRRSCEWIV